MDQGVNAGYFDQNIFEDKLKARLTENHGQNDLIENVSNNQIFLSKPELQRLRLSSKSVQEFIAETIIDMDHIDKQIRAKIKVTVSNANYLIEDLSHELKQLKIQPIDSKGSKDNSTVSERRELEEKMNKRLNFKNKNLKGQS